MAISFLRDPHTGEYKYIRKLRNKWQARPWVGGQRINLGLFDSEWSAAEAVAKLIYRNERPRRLPRYVRFDGERYEARVVLSDPLIVRLGVYNTEHEAHAAVARDRKLRRKACHWMVKKSVRQRRGKWEARTVRYHSRVVRLGYYDTVEQAESAVWRCLVQHAGIFAPLLLQGG